MHLWHDIPIGSRAPEVFTYINEIPAGCRNKYELNKETGVIWVDRVLPYSIYPANYGFIPRTYAYDDDPLDVVLLASSRIHPACLAKAKPIGVMQMIDDGKVDSKIIAVQPRDPEYAGLNEITELPDHKLREIKHFFQEYKIMETKEVEVQDFEPAARAKEIIMATHRRYVEQFVSSVAFKKD